MIAQNDCEILKKAGMTWWLVEVVKAKLIAYLNVVLFFDMVKIILSGLMICEIIKE